jgi:trk system potassium uptake protein TrkH
VIRPKVLLYYIGLVIAAIGLAMSSSVFWSVYYNEHIVLNLVFACIITEGVGIACIILGRQEKAIINYRECFALVTLGWAMASIFGALPFMVSGYFGSLANSIFESVSGFTTTGASILTDIEAIPKSVLFWRSLIQWLGGMGILTLFVAIIVEMGVGANQVFQTEAPGPVLDKVTPRIRETARKLWITYLVLSVILFLLLKVFGMTVYDALCHTFTTMATGGFSTRNQSIAYYGPAIQWIIIIFMFIAGVNFSLHYLAFSRRSISGYFKDNEFRMYLILTVLATSIVFMGINQFPNLEERIRIGLFQVISIMTTTGFAAADYTLWSSTGQAIIFMLMFVGGCAGSTVGNIKVGRLLIMTKLIGIELKKIIHPRAVIPLHHGDKVFDSGIIINILQFFFLYMFSILAGTVVMGILGFDLLSGFTGAAACMGNIGPAFGSLGPALNYASVPDAGKYALCILMLLGRLEIYPVLVLLSMSFWKR